MATQARPYLFFYGKCSEALEFYKSVFDGSYEAMRVGESPVREHMPPGSDDNVMHASFTSEIVRFYASDGRETKAVDSEAGNVSLALDFDDPQLGERTFDRLAEGGKVEMPINAAFWGGRFGSVVDRFGTEWILTLP